MAIKYNTLTGDDFINTKARRIRDHALKPKLAGIRCTNCGGDSEITFHQSTDYAGSGSVNWKLHPCCTAFEKKVYERLEMNR